MTSDSPNDDALEVERMLLDEPTESERMAAIQASNNTLVGTVREIAQKAVLQVRLCAITIADVSMLRELPNDLAKQIEDDTTAIDVDHISKSTRILVDPHCTQSRENWND
ncbi:unnamed protein product [Heligmosomoides polygyrus]|uniref:Nbl1_Borealin_N domain-containing protein n=1 Tax=Heligmosomoides polygyrus TaxID=6339 RepID=A0A183G5E6_HELPZ|nr:unnamed protein product [Heligmosomoides polygyrus]